MPSSPNTSVPPWIERPVDPSSSSMLSGISLSAGMVLATKYRLERHAGYGGMAQIWVATNQATGAEVCVKVLASGGDDESVERFRREAHAAARLNHRAIVRVFDLLELTAEGDIATKDNPAALAIVMELLQGESLGDRLYRLGKLSVDESLDIAIPVVSALAHAHRAGVVHRDIKPDNIFLSTDSDDHVTPKVLDFGISKFFTIDAKPITHEGVTLGTPSFMSPEQARGASTVDARSDVFSAGITMYMMITGKNPFDSDAFHSVLSAIVQREPPKPPELSDVLWEVLSKALQKSPSARYADATEFGIALRRAAGRMSATDAGVSSSQIRLSSVVSVPPIGNVVVADGEDGLVVPAPAKTHRNALIAVCALAFTIGAVALVTRVSRPNADTSELAPKAQAAAIGPSAVETATSSPSASRVAPVAEADAGAVAIAKTSHVAPPKADARPKTAPKRKPAPAVGKGREPSIVRDPGF